MRLSKATSADRQPDQQQDPYRSTSFQHSAAAAVQPGHSEADCFSQPLSPFDMSKPEPSQAESCAGVQRAGFDDLADFFLFADAPHNSHDFHSSKLDTLQSEPHDPCLGPCVSSADCQSMDSSQSQLSLRSFEFPFWGSQALPGECVTSGLPFSSAHAEHMQPLHIAAAAGPDWTQLYWSLAGQMQLDHGQLLHSIALQQPEQSSTSALLNYARIHEQIQVIRSDAGMQDRQWSQMDYADLLRADHLLKDLHEKLRVNAAASQAHIDAEVQALQSRRLSGSSIASTPSHLEAALGPGNSPRAAAGLAAVCSSPGLMAPMPPMTAMVAMSPMPPMSSPVHPNTLSSPRASAPASSFPPLRSMQSLPAVLPSTLNPAPNFPPSASPRQKRPVTPSASASQTAHRRQLSPPRAAAQATAQLLGRTLPEGLQEPLSVPATPVTPWSPVTAPRPWTAPELPRSHAFSSPEASVVPVSHAAAALAEQLPRAQSALVGGVQMQGLRRKRSATELEQLTQQVAGLPWLDTPPPLQLGSSAISLSLQSPSPTRKASRSENRLAPGLEDLASRQAAVQLTHLQAMVEAECGLLSLKLGPTHVLSMLPQQASAQDHVIVSFHPVAMHSGAASLRPDSASDWQQLLIRVPLDYPQHPPLLLFPTPADFLECCQADTAKSVCMTALSAYALPLNLEVAARTWLSSLSSVRKAYNLA